MWNTILNINSLLVIGAGGFFIYAIGAAILTGAWKQLGIAIIVLILGLIVEIILGMLSE